MKPADADKYGSPLAYRNLFTQKGNKEAFLILAIWNCLEGLTSFAAGNLAVVGILGLILDMMIAVGVFCYIMKTSTWAQRKYVIMLLAWNFADTIFLLFPPSVAPIIAGFRSVVDPALNVIIVLMAYYRPYNVDFAPLKDKAAANRQAKLLADPFDVGDGGKFSLPPMREIVSALQLRERTVSKEIRLRQTPERMAGGSKPDPDIGAINYEQLQETLNPAPVQEKAAAEFVPVVKPEPTPVAEVVPTKLNVTVQSAASSPVTRSIMATPAGVNTSNGVLSDDEFIRYTAASRILEANDIWRKPTITDSNHAEAMYEKALELEAHCPLLKTAFNELRDLVTTRRRNADESFVPFKSKAIVTSVYERYKSKLT